MNKYKELKTKCNKEVGGSKHHNLNMIKINICIPLQRRKACKGNILVMGSLL